MVFRCFKVKTIEQFLNWSKVSKSINETFWVENRSKIVFWMIFKHFWLANFKWKVSISSYATLVIIKFLNSLYIFSTIKAYKTTSFWHWFLKDNLFDIKILTYRLEFLVNNFKRNPNFVPFLFGLFQFFQVVHRKQETSQNTPLIYSINKLCKYFILVKRISIIT